MIIRPWPIVAALLVLVPSSEVAARTWDVPSEIPTIQAAIDTAADADTVLVGPGTYLERLTISNKNLTLLGTGGAESTFLSGLGLSGDGKSILLMINVDTTMVISGFTFENGGDSSLSWGGAITVEAYEQRSSPRIENNRFEGNLAGWGGAIDLCGADARIEGNVFAGNTALVFGGAIMVECGSSPTIVANVFKQNRALGVHPVIGQGGGIAFMFGSGNAAGLVISNLFYDNEAGYGAAITVERGSPTIRNNTIAFNRSTRVESGRAAGIRVYGITAPEIYNNIVVLNENGWGISTGGGALPVLQCNDFWLNELGDYYNQTPGMNDVSIDPLFCDPFSRDFTLAQDSPCLESSNEICGLIGALGAACSDVVGIDGKDEKNELALRTLRRPSGVEFVWQGLTDGLSQSVSLEIFSVTGELVHSHHVPGPQSAGTYLWRGYTDRGSVVASGVYYARIKAGTQVAVSAFPLIR